jgi:hypothetical protein
MPQSKSKEQRKSTWLAREKMAWFEQRRSMWEANGKPISWAEWLARREYEWAVNELPNRELHWALWLGEESVPDRLVASASEGP